MNRTPRAAFTLVTLSALLLVTSLACAQEIDADRFDVGGYEARRTCTGRSGWRSASPSAPR
ncbi:MAG: hypothetical protein M9894_34715 [Planctomycetes bacterium]|nr:hypothetical protein [Planctomycetota bacterium]